jgi:hypothetical protein
MGRAPARDGDAAGVAAGTSFLQLVPLVDDPARREGGDLDHQFREARVRAKLVAQTNELQDVTVVGDDVEYEILVPMGRASPVVVRRFPFLAAINEEQLEVWLGNLLAHLGSKFRKVGGLAHSHTEFHWNGDRRGPTTVVS